MTHHAGNTAAEYGLIAGVVAITALAALSMTGHSITNLFNGTAAGTRQPAVQGMMQLNFQPGGGIGGAAQNGAGMMGSGASGMQATVGADGQSVLNLAGGSASGTNATSIEGKQTMVNTSYAAIRTVEQLTALADTLPDGLEKRWILGDLVPRTTFMATAEGYTAGIQSFKTGMNYSDSSAVADVNNFQAELQDKLANPTFDAGTGQGAQPVAVDPAVMQQVQAILQPTIQNAQQMVTQASPGTQIDSPQGLDWQVSIYKALGTNSTTGYDDTSYNAAMSVINAAKADQSLYQSPTAAGSVTSADQLQQTAATMPGSPSGASADTTPH